MMKRRFRWSYQLNEWVEMFTCKWNSNLNTESMDRITVTSWYAPPITK